MTEHETPEEIMASLQKREEMFEQWAKSRDCVRRSEAKTEAANMVTKSAPATRTTSGEAQRSRNIAEWFDQNQLTPIIEAVGEELGKLRASLRSEFKAALELEATKIRNELLQIQLDEARGVKRPLRVVGDAKDMIG